MRYRIWRLFNSRNRQNRPSKEFTGVGLVDAADVVLYAFSRSSTALDINGVGVSVNEPRYYNLRGYDVNRKFLVNDDISDFIFIRNSEAYNLDGVLHNSNAVRRWAS